MSIPADILERLVAMGENPARFLDLVESQGADFLRSYVRRLEESAALFHQWSPKLREFAMHCRSVNKCPDPETLSDQERSKLPIYESKIMTAERLRSRVNEIIFCSIPLIGISVAQRLWPGADTRSIILTPEELGRWHDIYNHPQNAFQWWMDYWWDIEDPPNPQSVQNQRRDLTVADGETPWLVTSGLSWGALAGGYDTELWSWNGREAKFVRDIDCTTF